MRLIILLLCLSHYFINAQTKKPDSVFCDCEKARVVILKGNAQVGPTIPPFGFGDKNEIGEGKQGSVFTFEKEHYSSWYKLLVQANGHLTFDIIPANPEDDYDFMLFSAGSKFFCDSFLRVKQKPIRACISRNKKELKGFTGLKLKTKKELVKEGPGESYVRSVDVKRGDVYYLVLDNVHENGGGHTINFFYEEIVTVSGQVTDEHFKPLKTDITITNNSGDTIEKSFTDDEGYYRIEAALRKNLKYSVNYFSDKAFFNTKEISTQTQADSLKNIRTILPALKKGGKYIIKNINFFGGSDIYLPSALPSVHSLYKIMKKNPGLKILIVGHTNGCSGVIDDQKLSENRAAAIKNFMLKKDIDQNRIYTEGRNCTEMLYPPDGPEWQQSLNRRVEIKVLEK